MPRVGFAMPQQGFRPRTNPLGALRGIGLRGLGDANTFSGCTSAVDADGNAVACSDPSAAVWFDNQMNAVPAGTSTGVSAAGAAAGGAPSGSQLLYQGTWQVTATLNINTIISRVSQAIRANGLQVVSAQNTGSVLSIGNFNVAFTLQVIGPGFAQPVDAGSIVDHAYYSVVGRMPVFSATVLQSAPGSSLPTIVPPTPGATPGATGITAWLESNALWLGLGIVAITVLPALVKKL